MTAMQYSSNCPLCRQVLNVNQTVRLDFRLRNAFQARSLTYLILALGQNTGLGGLFRKFRSCFAH